MHLTKLILIFSVLAVAGCHSKHEVRRVGDEPDDRQQEKLIASLSEESYLRKLSFHIRGVPPSLDEYEALEASKMSGSSARFFQKKKKEYLASSYHIEKMNWRLNELFMVRSDLSHPEWPAVGINVSDYREKSEYKTLNSMNALFRNMIYNNESWDTLLLGREYKIHNLLLNRNVADETVDDSGFFKRVSKEKLPPTLNDSSRFFRNRMENGISSVIVNFADDNPQIAGAVTTARFFERYSTTAVNKNRRRAAALFRMFLCDNMVAVSVDQKGQLDPIFELIYPAQKLQKNSPIMTAADVENRHGSEPDCMKCHYKLDPMGKVFESSAFTLNPFASGGALVYKNGKDQMVNVQVKGFRSLAKAIVEQPEYLNCQVQHFWNWYIGADVPLSESRRQELVKAFDNVGRKVNDFVAYLVDQPEFGATLQVGSVSTLTEQVRTIFNRCDSCHVSEAGKVPALAVFPIGGSREAMLKMVESVSAMLDLDGDGSKAKMPPRNSAWKMSKTERDQIRKWIKLGAPLEGGDL